MSAPDIHSHLLRPLTATGLPYMVTGGVAAIMYGEPRLTNDVDVVMALEPVQAGRLAAAFPPPAYYAPPVEIIATEASRKSSGHFNLLHIDTALRADVYVAGTDPFAAWGLAHTQDVSVAGEEIPVAPIEYVIVMKLRYHRDSSADRHLRDIAAMVRLSGDRIDYTLLDDWVDRLGLRRQWLAAASSLQRPPRR